MNAGTGKCPNCGEELGYGDDEMTTVCIHCAYPLSWWPAAQKSAANHDQQDTGSAQQLAKVGLPLAFQAPSFNPSHLKQLLAEDAAPCVFANPYPPLRLTSERLHCYYGLEPLTLGGTEYYLCNEWTDESWHFMQRWLRQFNINATCLQTAYHAHIPTKSTNPILPPEPAALSASVDHRSHNLHGMPHFSLEQAVPDLSFTKPRCLVIGLRKLTVSSWRDVLEAVARHLYQVRPQLLAALAGIHFTKWTERICLQRSPDTMVNSLKIAENLWLETNFSAIKIIRLCCDMVAVCAVSMQEFVVYYSRPDKTQLPSAGTPSDTKNPSSADRLPPMPVDSIHAFRKPLDWSTFALGVTIPVKHHQAFKQNLSFELLPGMSRQITIRAHGIAFTATIVLRIFSAIIRSQFLQIRWSLTSPLCVMLQDIFPVAYAQMRENHNNRNGINDSIIIACGKKRDEFLLSFDGPGLEKTDGHADAGTHGAAEIDLTPFRTALLQEFPAGDTDDPPTAGQLSTMPNDSSRAFHKSLDWSTFVLGVSVPVRLHQAFRQHLSCDLQPGISRQITVWIQGTAFIATISQVKFMVERRSPVIQIRWCQTSPISVMLQNMFPASYAQLRQKTKRRLQLLQQGQKIFPGAYAQLQDNPKDRHGINHSITVACGKECDEFLLAFEGSASEKTDVERSKAWAPGAEEIDLIPYRAALLQEFPSGFAFVATSFKLLESALGMPCPQHIRDSLKQTMFARQDGTYLLPEMVCDDAVLQAMRQHVADLLAQSGCFSLSFLQEQYAPLLRFLPNSDHDFRLFSETVLLPHVSVAAKIIGKRELQLCIRKEADEEIVLDGMAETIENLLVNAQDAVSVAEIAEQFPHLHVNVIQTLLKARVKSAVCLSIDGLEYWKLLECFNLPHDFSDVVTDIVTDIERQQATSSIQTITTALENKYGNKFFDIYPLSDDEVFKQVVCLSFNGKPHVWRNRVFANASAKNRFNVADEFLQTYSGFFHEDEFFSYAREMRGMNNHGMLILTFLRLKCIRLDARRWIGQSTFFAQSTWSSEFAMVISQKLIAALGDRPFLPLGTLPSSFFDTLPMISINANTIYWNAYLLVSVASLLIPSLRIVNDEPSPYTVTAMLVPENTSFKGDVIDYVLEIFKESGSLPPSVDAYFDCLKQNQIRMTKTDKLMERIQSFLG